MQVVIIFDIPSKPENTCQSDICFKTYFQNVDSLFILLKYCHNALINTIKEKYVLFITGK